MIGTGSALLAQMPAPPPLSSPPANQAQAQPLPPQQLDNLVAPVALYPDPLLGQALVASTYPLELVEAQQWLQANGNLHGQQLMDAARQQNWDASVQALVAMPDVLTTLTQQIRWTTDLGNAFLAQQADVMNAVQRMRQRAQANGRLQSTPQETVTTDTQGGQSAIQIQPADPQVIYVPAYDPNYVWGPPAWGYYPPLYYPDYGLGFEPGIDIGFCFGGWGGWGFAGWGWSPNWFGGGVFVNGGFFNRYGYRYGYGFGSGLNGRAGWVHDPAHRTGVAYPNSRLNSQFGAASQASRVAAGRSGNFQRFGGQGTAGVNSGRGGGTAQAGARNNFAGRSATPQAGARNNVAGSPGSSNWQRFQGQRGQAPGQSFQSPQAQRSQVPTQRYQASPAQRYQAPMQRSAPMQSAPRMSAPSFGGGSRSFGGGGGGMRSSGGGGHGGGRR